MFQNPYNLLGYGYAVTKEYANSNSAGFKVIDVEKIKAEHPDRIFEDDPYGSLYVEEYGEKY